MARAATANVASAGRTGDLRDSRMRLLVVSCAVHPGRPRPCGNAYIGRPYESTRGSTAGPALPAPARPSPLARRAATRTTALGALRARRTRPWTAAGGDTAPPAAPAT